MNKEDNLLFRLIYASTIDPNLLEKHTIIIDKILKSAHSHNPKYNINGILLYCEGYFFQCLEGPKCHVDELFNRIHRDPKHENITVLLASYINFKYFGRWSMKFVEGDKVIKKHLLKIGFHFFNPYLLSTQATNSLLMLFKGLP